MNDMKIRQTCLRRLYGTLACIVWAICYAFFVDPTNARTLDDFASALRFGWSDFTFGTGSVTQSPPELRFEIPAAIAQPMFVASVRVAEWLTLGESQLELRIDVAGANSPDAFAVLGWLPESLPSTAFAGYFIAKSGQELRVGKAINRYFYRGALDPTLANASATLVLDLTQTNGAVTIEAKILDPVNAGAVLFDRVFIDSPSADTLQEGTDDPPAPYTGRGHFALMEYVETPGNGAATRETAFTNAVVSLSRIPRRPLRH